MHYQSGSVRYINDAASSWSENSGRTVKSADLCVFVILERFGEITWSVELQEALVSGVPFILLCLTPTYSKYLTLTRAVSLDSIRDSGEKNLVETMHGLEVDRELTIVPFEYGQFAAILRRQMSQLFDQSLQLMKERSQRKLLGLLLGDPASLTLRDLAFAEELALDELEDIAQRKRAFAALLARSAASEDTAIALVGSETQGIQRMAIQNLERLHSERPPDPEFLATCVQIANQSDDVGVARRLIPALFRMDCAAALEALDQLDVSEIGTRRRIAQELEAHESTIVASSLQKVALPLARKCKEDKSPALWRTRLDGLIERLAE